MVSSTCRFVVLGGAAATALMIMAASAPVSAQKVVKGDAKRIESIQGVDTFNAYCAVCHGKTAKGDGPAAKALTKSPADLTRIAVRRGNFSRSDVESIILGKQEMISHGTREMPIWGPVLQALSPDDSFMKLRVANLVDYLQAIQTK